MKYTAFLYPLKGPEGGGGGGGSPPILVGVGNPVLVETELPLVMVLLLQLVGVTLTLVIVVEDIVVTISELLVGTGNVLVGVLVTSVVPVLELVDVPTIVEDDDVRTHESPTWLLVTFGAKA